MIDPDLLVCLPDHLSSKEWADLHGFPPSYYYGEGKETALFIGPVHLWCRQTLGYSPPLYWGSDTPVADDDYLIEDRSWFCYFNSAADKLLFKMRWLDRSVPFSELVKPPEEPLSPVEARIKHVRSQLG